MDEEWREIPGFPMYEVSDQGRVRSWQPQSHTAAPRVQPRVLRPGRSGKRRLYTYVNLCRDGVPFMRYVHRLVLEAFVGPCPAGMECRHFPNAAPTDNRLVNLSWGTRIENAEDKVTHGTTLRGRTKPPETVLRGDAHGRRKLSSEQVLTIRELLSGGVSQSELAEEYGVTYATINNIRLRKNWSHL